MSKTPKKLCPDCKVAMRHIPSQPIPDHPAIRQFYHRCPKCGCETTLDVEKVP